MPSLQPSENPRDPMSVLWMIGGFALIAYGGFRLYQSRGGSQTGALMVAAGLTMMPWAIVGIIGGIGLIGVAVWVMTLSGKGGFDYVIILLALIFGVTAIMERVKRLKR